MAITTINTAAENSMKLIFFITPGLKGMRTVMKAHKKPAAATIGKNQLPNDSSERKNGPVNDIRKTSNAAKMESKMKSMSLLTV